MCVVCVCVPCTSCLCVVERCLLEGWSFVVVVVPVEKTIYNVHWIVRDAMVVSQQLIRFIDSRSGWNENHVCNWVAVILMNIPKHRRCLSHLFWKWNIELSTKSYWWYNLVDAFLEYTIFFESRRISRRICDTIAFFEYFLKNRAFPNKSSLEYPKSMQMENVACPFTSAISENLNQISTHYLVIANLVPSKAAVVSLMRALTFSKHGFGSSHL